MDASLKKFVYCTVLLLIYHVPRCHVKNVHRLPTRITQISHTLAVTPPTRTNKRSPRRTTTKEKLGPIIKEFPLKSLMDIGLSSNKANMFIRSRTMKGKPLEKQFENTRELDMLNIEKQILKATEVYRKMVQLMKLQKQKKNSKNKNKTTKSPGKAKTVQKSIEKKKRKT